MRRSLFISEWGVVSGAGPAGLNGFTVLGAPAAKSICSMVLLVKNNPSKYIRVKVEKFDHKF